MIERLESMAGISSTKSFHMVSFTEAQDDDGG